MRTALLLTVFVSVGAAAQESSLQEATPRAEEYAQRAERAMRADAAAHPFALPREAASRAEDSARENVMRAIWGAREFSLLQEATPRAEEYAHREQEKALQADAVARSFALPREATLRAEDSAREKVMRAVWDAREFALLQEATPRAEEYAQRAQEVAMQADAAAHQFALPREATSRAGDSAREKAMRAVWDVREFALLQEATPRAEEYAQRAQEVAMQADAAAHQFALPREATPRAEDSAREKAARADWDVQEFALLQDATPRAEDSAQRAERAAMRADSAARATAKADAPYRSGTRAIDSRQYESAVGLFDQVIERKGDRADGAMYWKAYAENKLGRRDEALAALAQLQKEFPQSRWVNDAKALEVELKQASGQPVSPDAESDEDLKVLAINGLMGSDPGRALPLLQKVIADPKASPKLKERALFVVAQSGDPKARDILFQIAKGGSNPDMQMKAVEYLGVFSRGNTQLLSELYGATGDPAIKRAVIRGLMIAQDTDRLVALAKAEKSPELRKEAIRMLGVMRRDRTGDALVSMYGSESDRGVKQAIVEGLFIQQNVTALIALARKEADMAMKKDLVQKLSIMRSKEATDYMMEVLNK